MKVTLPALSEQECHLHEIDLRRDARKVVGLHAIVADKCGLLLVWWTPTYANSAFNSNSMGLRYPSVECLRRGL